MGTLIFKADYASTKFFFAFFAIKHQLHYLQEDSTMEEKNFALH
jgi:hypothetical protein